MNKKQRHDRYVHAYEQVLQLKEIGKCDYHFEYLYVCDILSYDNGKDFNHIYEADLFEEFLLFQPKKIEGLGWWNEYDFNSRLNALAFCIAMTE